MEENTKFSLSREDEFADQGELLILIRLPPG